MFLNAHCLGVTENAFGFPDKAPTSVSLTAVRDKPFLCKLSRLAKHANALANSELVNKVVKLTEHLATARQPDG
jgi:hypothetical protein